MKIQRKTWINAIAATLFAATPALATIPYTPVPTTAPVLGPGYAKPFEVFGKEYSHDFDHTTAGAGGAPDAQQVVQWDGIGGTTDGLDFTATRPTWTPDEDIDAIAAKNDAFFRNVVDDTANMIFSHDDTITVFSVDAAGGLAPSPFFVPSAGPIFLSNGNVIGGSGEVSIEEAAAYAAPETQGVWATLPEVNGMPLPVDTDGLEVWGVEPPNSLGDTDKYSLDLDLPNGTSVWNASGTSYISHATVLGAVTSLLGPLPPGAFLPHDNADGEAIVNLDAMMIREGTGEDDLFDGVTGTGDSDEIIFSIRQIVDLSDPSGYYATGSELFLMDAFGGVSFLSHGGHVWDKGYALSSLALAGPDLDNAFGVIDINALEAIGTTPEVPEPAGAVILLGMFSSAALMRYRLG